MSNMLLGREAIYSSNYTPDLLYPIARDDNRKLIGSNINFYGLDIWNCYEVSWLNLKGKPEVRILELYIPSSTPNLVESKSLKLYLNSLNNERFENSDVLLSLIKEDIENTIKGEITAIFRPLNYFEDHQIKNFQGLCLDDLDISCQITNHSSDLLKTEEGEAEESLFSNLLKSNCLITNQPDWASLYVNYKGRKINHESLLKYIISFRNHNEFHEHCVERMYADIMEKCQCAELAIYARYTRRGGIDINPFRSSKPVNNIMDLNIRLARQ